MSVSPPCNSVLWLFWFIVHVNETRESIHMTKYIAKTLITCPSDTYNNKIHT